MSIHPSVGSKLRKISVCVCSLISWIFAAAPGFFYVISCCSPLGGLKKVSGFPGKAGFLTQIPYSIILTGFWGVLPPFFCGFLTRNPN